MLEETDDHQEISFMLDFNNNKKKIHEFDRQMAVMLW